MFKESLFYLAWLWSHNYRKIKCSSEYEYVSLCVFLLITVSDCNCKNNTYACMCPFFLARMIRSLISGSVYKCQRDTLFIYVKSSALKRIAWKKYIYKNWFFFFVYQQDEVWLFCTDFSKVYFHKDIDWAGTTITNICISAKV